MRGTPLAEPAMVGRERELGELFRCLDSAFEGKGTTVLLSGEAGTGKTRVTNEFLKAVREKNMNVLSGWCLNNAVTPYFPFVEAFKSYYSAADSELIQREGLEINAWLTGLKQGEKSETYRNLTPQGWKDLTFEVVSKTLQSISAEKPSVLFLEDIHWADSASLALLHYISRTIGSLRILLLATFRSEELTADVEGYGHPLAEELRLMRRENLVREIHLANLDQACVTKIAENMVGGEVTSELAEQLAKESQGNALFVVESLRMLFERGSLYQENDRWRLTGDTLVIPDKIKDVILRRLSRLKFSQRRALDAASVIGEKFDVDLLSVVLDQDSLEVLENLNTIARSTSLIGVEEDFFRFDHAKSREAIYEEIAVPLKKGYHGRIAEKLEGGGKDGRLPLSDIAYHYAEAGMEEKAVEFAMATGQDALARFSNAEAVKHFDYVLRTVTDAPEKGAIKSMALERLGDAYYSSARYMKASELFEVLAFSETGKVRLRAYRKAMDSAIFGPAGKVHALELAAKAEPYGSYDRLEYARIRFLKSTTLRSKQDIEKELDAALQVFEEEYSLHDIAKALSVRSNLIFFGVQAKNSLCNSLRAVAMHKELYGDSNELALTLITSALVLMHAGLLQESMSQLADVLRVGDKIGNYHRSAAACVVMNRILEAQGKIDEALSVSLKCLRCYGETDGQRRQDRVWADIARQSAKLGDLSRAEEFIRQMTSVRPTPIDLYDPEGILNKRDSLRSLAVFFAATNRWKEAYEYLDEALKITKRVPAYPALSKILVRTDYAWVLNRQGRTGEAQAQVDEIQKVYEQVDREFANVSIDANLLAPRNVVSGEEFEMRLDLVNVSRKTGLLAKVTELVPLEFKVVGLIPDYAIENGFVDMKEKSIGPFEVKTVRLRLKASKPGVFSISPQLTYIDQSGEAQTCQFNQVTITAKPTQPKYEVLPGRLTTGILDLDTLLLGGIPEKFSVVLTSPSKEDREFLIQKFLEAGARVGETTFHLTTEAGYTKALAERYPSDFVLLISNPQAEAVIESLPNVFKLNGVENLTDIDIALTRAFRTLPPSKTGPKRICLELVSDVLLQHHAVNTRRWLSSLLQTLKSKGFTILAVIDPGMHPAEETQAVLGLFDGEISIYDKETPKGAARYLRTKRMTGQKYLKDEIPITEEQY